MVPYCRLPIPSAFHPEGFRFANYLSGARKTSGMSLKPRFGRAQGLAGDGAGRIYVADAFQGAVKVFDATGALTGTIGRFGDRKGELQLPQSLAVDSNNRLLVTSTGNARLEIYGLDDYTDPRVRDASVRFLRLGTSAVDRWAPRAPLWAAIDVSGAAATLVDPSSLTVNGVAARRALPRREASGAVRVWAAFDRASVLATLPSDRGWVSVRGELRDGSEFEGAGWVAGPETPRGDPPVPEGPTGPGPSRPKRVPRGPGRPEPLPEVTSR